MRVVEILRDGARQRIVTYLSEDEVQLLDGIPPQAVIALLNGEEELIFNSVFREFLHQTIARFAPLDPDMRQAAAAHRDGRLVYVDDRLPAGVDPVPDEDVIGWFRVRDGEILPDSYLPNPHHALQGAHGITAAIAAMRHAMAHTLLSAVRP